MGKFFFSGCVHTKLDEKGRFVLPQQMRLGLVEDGCLEFAIALGLGGCVSIYRKSDIEKIVERFREKQHIGKYQKFFTLFFSTLYMETCDKIGRVILPANLKKMTNIHNDLVIAGVMNKIELWPKDLYEKNLKDPESDIMKMSEEAFMLLGNEITENEAIS